MKDSEASSVSGSGQDEHRATPALGTSSAAGNSWSKWLSPRRWPFWVCLVFLIYTLGGFYGAPRLLERMATKKVAELGRTLSFGEIRVNPFLLTLQMKDTEMRDTDGTLLFSYDDYFFNLQASSLFRWAWTFKEIRLAGLQLNWERFAPGDDRFGRLIDSFPVAEKAEAETEARPLPRLVIEKLQVSNAGILLTDHLEYGTFGVTLGPIDAEVSHLTTLPDESGQQQVRIHTASGGEIAWQGSLQLAPLQSAGNVTVQGRILKDFDHYLRLFTTARVTGDHLEWGFNYRVEQMPGQDLSARVDDFHASFDGWKVYLPDEPDPLIDLPVLQVNGASLRWPQQELDIASVELQGARLNLDASAEGSLNLDRLLADFAGEKTGADASPARASTGTAAWHVQLARLSLEQAAVRYRDASTDPIAEVGLQDISLEVAGIDNQPGTRLPVQAAFALASGGSGRFEGEAVVLPEFSTSGRFGLDSLQLQLAQPWVNRLARVTLNSGGLTLNGEVVAGPDQPGAFRGLVEVAGLEISDQRQQEKLLAWQQLAIERVEVDLAANSIHTSELKFDQPYGRLQIARDKTTNLDGLMVESEKAETAEPTGDDSAAPLAITIAGFRISDAGLDFSDLSLPLPFAAAIRSLDGTISTLATNSEEPARVDLEGQVNEFGLARIGGSLNAWDPTGYTDIQMTFRNLEMERITPYTIEFAGWEIDSGRMDLQLDYKINKGQLLGANDIVIREMTVGDKVENASGTSLPLKFAVALLKDSNGVIDVDLPVAGDLNDPTFKISGIVWRAIGNLLTKVVTAPFRLLGSLVGVDSEDFGTLRFSAGKAEISPPDRESLLKLAEAMRQRPELKLEVAGTYSGEVDTRALQTQQAEQRLATAVSELQVSASELTTSQRRQVMEQLLATSMTAEDFVALQQQYSSIPDGEDPEKAQPVLDETAYLEALRQKLIAAEPVGDAELTALAQARADAVMAALAGENADNALPVTRLEAVAVVADDSDEVPLELKVEAASE